MNEQDVTICAKCKHCRVNSDGPRTNVWYNWFCYNPKVERQLGVDPVTGDQCYHVQNSLGESVTSDEAFPVCRSVNKGYCELWEAGNKTFQKKNYETETRKPTSCFERNQIR